MILNDIKSDESSVRAVLVGVDTSDMKEGECDVSLDELERLADTAGADVAARLVQAREKPDVIAVRMGEYPCLS